jgi:hypothetical protein
MSNIRSRPANLSPMLSGAIEQKPFDAYVLDYKLVREDTVV